MLYHTAFMAETGNNEFVRQVAEQKYEFGFTTNVHTDIIEKGLNEDVVRLISQKKGEPEWMLEFRLKAFNYWKTLRQPTWGHLTMPDIDYQAISYYADPLAKKPKNKEIDPELEKTFDKLGIPLEEFIVSRNFDRFAGDHLVVSLVQLKRKKDKIIPQRLQRIFCHMFHNKIDQLLHVAPFPALYLQPQPGDIAKRRAIKPLHKILEIHNIRLHFSHRLSNFLPAFQ